MQPTRSTSAFTLIELLIVIGMIAILASIVLVGVNPLRQFAVARNAQRASDVNALLNAIGNRMAENEGVFSSDRCPALPTAATDMAKSSYNIRPCLVPDYVSELPFDPSSGSNACTTDSCADGTYDTRYTVMQNAATGRITVCAPLAAETAIRDSKPYCLTR
jgi:prepilin-type N-terminal cleavage/methylation domain-containing protein